MKTWLQNISFIQINENEILMKKKQKSFAVELPNKSLDLEDIKKIEQIFKENGFSYEIALEEYQLNSSDEFSQLPDHLKTTEYLEIEARKNKSPTERYYIVFKFKPHSIWIFSADSDLISSAIINEITKIIAPNKPSFSDKFASLKSLNIYLTVGLINFLLQVILFFFRKESIKSFDLFITTFNNIYYVYMVLFLINLAYNALVNRKKSKALAYLTPIEKTKRKVDYPFIATIAALFLTFIGTFISLATLGVTVAGKEARCWLKLDSCNTPLTENQKLPNNK